MMQAVRLARSHPMFSNLIVYAVIFFVTGASVTSLGSLFPYLAQKNHNDATEWSFLIVCRSAGFITGAITINIFNNYLGYHGFLAAGTVISGLFLILFTLFQGMIFQGACMFLYAMGYASHVIFISICVMQCFKDQNRQKYLLLTHASYGIGGFLGPLFVYMFELYAYFFIGCLFILIVPIILKKKSPQTIKCKEIEDPLINYENNQKTVQLISNKCKYLIGFIFFFVIGQERVFSGWISSFSVLENFSSKQHANIYNSIYWVSIMFFRTFLIFVPGKPQKKFCYLVFIAILQSLVSLFVIYIINPEVGIILSAIVFGLSNSILVPLLLLTSTEYNMKITPKHNSFFSLSGAMGDGVLSYLVSFLMTQFSNKLFFYSMGFINLVILLLHIYAQKVFRLEEIDNERKNYGIQMKKVEINDN